MEIDVWALYLIAAPKTPEPIRAEAVKRAEKGERVTHEAVVELRKQFEETGELPNSEVGLTALIADAKQIAARAPVVRASTAVRSLWT